MIKKYVHEHHEGDYPKVGGAKALDTRTLNAVKSLVEDGLLQKPEPKKVCVCVCVPLMDSAMSGVQWGGGGVTDPSARSQWRSLPQDEQ
jgi:hypothetical protein